MSNNLYQIWGETFKKLFNEVKYRTQGNALHVFNGKSLRKQFRTKPNSSEVSKPNVIMSHYDSKLRGDYLLIRREVYYEFIKLSPEFENEKLFLSYFKDWFKDKFNISPSKVEIDSKDVMDNMK